MSPKVTSHANTDRPRPERAAVASSRGWWRGYLAVCLGVALVLLVLPSAAAHAASGFDAQDCNQQIDVVNPAAGANPPGLTVPTGHEYELVDVSLSFQASATVASRVLSVTVVNGSFVVLYVANGVTVTASQTLRVQGVQGGGPGALSAGATAYVPLPQGLLLPAGYSVIVSAASIQTGDQWSGAIVYCDVTTANATQHLVHVDNNPTSMTVNTSPASPVTVNVTASGACPGATSTTTSTATSTTTTLPGDTPCKVALDGFTDDGLAVPVGVGLLTFAALFLLVVSWRHRRV